MLHAYKAGAFEHLDEYDKHFRNDYSNKLSPYAIYHLAANTFRLKLTVFFVFFTCVCITG